MAQALAECEIYPGSQPFWSVNWKGRPGTSNTSHAFFGNFGSCLSSAYKCAFTAASCCRPKVIEHGSEARREYEILVFQVRVLLGHQAAQVPDVRQDLTSASLHQPHRADCRWWGRWNAFVSARERLSARLIRCGRHLRRRGQILVRRRPLTCRRDGSLLTHR
jgi:hypothetical protein